MNEYYAWFRSPAGRSFAIKATAGAAQAVLLTTMFFGLGYLIVSFLRTAM